MNKIIFLPYLQNELVCCGVLSGNRNFEGRVHPNTRANYLASPLLVIAYAIAGTVDIDFEKEPLGKKEQVNFFNEIKMSEFSLSTLYGFISGHKPDDTPVFLRDIWPTRAEIQAVEQKHVIPAMFEEVYGKIEKGSSNWASLVAPSGKLYPWDVTSTYIKNPPYFNNLRKVI